jgi:hypothetical protein
MLEDAANINHIVVFLLPDSTSFVILANTPAVLPPDSGAAIHYQWPGKPFQLLGG